MSMIEAPREWLDTVGGWVGVNTTWAAARADEAIQKPSFIEWRSMNNENHLLCDEVTSNRILSEFWLSAWDNIVKEMWRGLTTLKIVGVGYNLSHQWDDRSIDEAEVAFRKAITESDSTSMSLCYTDQKNPNNFYMIWLSIMAADNMELWIFSVQDQAGDDKVAYMKV